MGSRCPLFAVLALSLSLTLATPAAAGPIDFTYRTNWNVFMFPGQPDPGDGERLRTAIAAAPGVILATPEYHGSFAAMTKLILENLGFPSVLAGKPVALVGVAAGRIGAIKSLEQLKSVCAHIGALVVPGAVSVAGVQSLFDAQGRCTDADVESMLRGVAHALLTFLKDYICPRHILEDMVRSDALPWATTIA